MPRSDATAMPAQAVGNSKVCASFRIRTPSASNDAAEVLGDDRADHREHARDLQRGEDVRQRGGNAYPAEDLEVACRVGTHQL